MVPFSKSMNKREGCHQSQDQDHQDHQNHPQQQNQQQPLGENSPSSPREVRSFPSPPISPTSPIISTAQTFDFPWSPPLNTAPANSLLRRNTTTTPLMRHQENQDQDYQHQQQQNQPQQASSSSLWANQSLYSSSSSNPSTVSPSISSPSVSSVASSSSSTTFESAASVASIGSESSPLSAVAVAASSASSASNASKASKSTHSSAASVDPSSPTASPTITDTAKTKSALSSSGVVSSCCSGVAKPSPSCLGTAGDSAGADASSEQVTTKEVGKSIRSSTVSSSGSITMLANSLTISSIFNNEDAVSTESHTSNNESSGNGNGDNRSDDWNEHHGEASFNYPYNNGGTGSSDGYEKSPNIGKGAASTMGNEGQVILNTESSGEKSDKKGIIHPLQPIDPVNPLATLLQSGRGDNCQKNMITMNVNEKHHYYNDHHDLCASPLPFVEQDVDYGEIGCRGNYHHNGHRARIRSNNTQQGSAQGGTLGGQCQQQQLQQKNYLCRHYHHQQNEHDHQQNQYGNSSNDCDHRAYQQIECNTPISQSKSQTINLVANTSTNANHQVASPAIPAPASPSSPTPSPNSPSPPSSPRSPLLLTSCPFAQSLPSPLPLPSSPISVAAASASATACVNNTTTTNNNYNNNNNNNNNNDNIGSSNNHSQPPLPFHSHEEVLFAERSIQRLVMNSRLFPPQAALGSWFRREVECRHHRRNICRCQRIEELDFNSSLVDECKEKSEHSRTPPPTTATATAITTPPSTHVTTLYEHELNVHKLLGHGGFCEVRLATLKKNDSSQHCQVGEQIKQERLQEHHRQKQEQQYAMKYLSPSIQQKSKKSFSRGAADLAIEARFLSVISHEYIIKLHYVSAGSLARNYNCLDGKNNTDDDHEEEEEMKALRIEQGMSGGRGGLRGEEKVEESSAICQDCMCNCRRINMEFGPCGSGSGFDCHLQQCKYCRQDQQQQLTPTKKKKSRKVLLRRFGYFLILDYLQETLLHRIKSTYIPEVVRCEGHHPKDHHCHHHCDVHPHMLGHSQGSLYSQQASHENDHWWNVQNWGHHHGKRSLSSSCSGDLKMRNMQMLLAKRMAVLKCIASALQYLHDECHIVFRDIKPDNIGFYQQPMSLDGDYVEFQDIPKLYDFGLAKELKATNKVTDEEGYETYRLTSKTGSRRYMSPEVALSRTYNHKADVFSFGMLMYEMATLIQPFEGYTMHRHESEVLRKGRRPCLVGYAQSSSVLSPLTPAKLMSSLTGGDGISEYWPLDLKLLIEDCWHADMKLRPEMKDIVQRLENCIEELIPVDHPVMEKASSLNDLKVGETVDATVSRSLLSGSFKGSIPTELQQYPTETATSSIEPKAQPSPSTQDETESDHASDIKGRKRLEQFIAAAAFAIPSPARSISGGSKRCVSFSKVHSLKSSKDSTRHIRQNEAKQTKENDVAYPASTESTSKSKVKKKSLKTGKKSLWSSVISQFRHDLSAATPPADFCESDPCAWNFT